MEQGWEPADFAWLEVYRGRTMWVGFSGGADSSALLLLLHRLDWRPIAVHFEHGWRGAESQAEARHAREFAAALGVPFQLIELHLPAGANAEAVARAARLAHWKRLTAGGDAVVALGHHADDAVENLLLRLGRGANVSGLTALRRERVVDGVTFVRPLLDWRRRRIEEFLNANHVTAWNCDSSNLENGYLRNFLRNRLLPEWEGAAAGVRDALQEACAVLTDDANYLEEQAERWYRDRPSHDGLAAAWFRALPAALRIRVLRRWLSDCAGHDRVPDRALLERLQRQTRGRIPLDATEELEYCRGFWRYRRCRTAETLWSWRTQPRIVCGDYEFTAAWDVEFPGTATLAEAWFDFSALPAELWLTPRRPGDRIHSFGAAGEQPLKKFGPAAVVVRDAAGVILWAPGIRHSAHAPVRPGAPAVRLQWHNKK